MILKTSRTARGAGVLQLVCALGALLAPASLQSVHAQEPCAAQDTDAAVPPGETLAPCLPPPLDLSLPAASPVKSDAERPGEVRRTDENAAPLPVVITPANGGAGARAGLHVLRDYNAQKATRKAEEAKALARRDLPVIKGPVMGKSALDVWSSIEAQGFDAGGGRGIKTGAGFDYSIIRNATVGVVAERDEKMGANEGESASDEKVSAYVSFKALPVVTIDARTQWEAEGAAAATDLRSTIILAPRIGTSFALDDGQTLQPFAGMKKSFALDTAGTDAGGAAAIDAAVAGVTLSRPDTYSLSVSADVSGVGGEEPASLNSKVQLRVPLP